MHSVKIKKGLDLRLEGACLSKEVHAAAAPESVAVFPDDFPGFIPRPAVKEGEAIACGDPLFTHKLDESIALTAPVSGTVTKIARGERRKILYVEIKPDKAGNSRTFNIAENPTAGSIKTLLLESGIWCMMRQRPYDIIPNPLISPRDIFVTTFDSSPLAPALTDILPECNASILQKEADALQMLTSGKVYYAVRKGNNTPVPNGVEVVEIEGPHPSGNPSVHINAVAPVNKGETVWTLDLTTLCKLGELLQTGKRNGNTVVALTGSEVNQPALYSTVEGASIASIVQGNLTDDKRNKRIISGNVLTGINVGEDGWLRFPYRQVTVIPEGDDVSEFMGWASMSTSKMSESRSFLSKLLRSKRFAPDARILGGRRPMILSCEYDRYMPMDIMPEPLIKAILAHDIERMEALGIYEVAPEDFALCEYADASKLELQKTVREGLDYLRKELE